MGATGPVEPAVAVASASPSSCSSPKIDTPVATITPPTTATLSPTSSSSTSGSADAMHKPAPRQGASRLTLQTSSLHTGKPAKTPSSRQSSIAEDDDVVSPASPQKPGAGGSGSARVVKPHGQGPADNLNIITATTPSAPDDGNVTPTTSSARSVLSESPPLCVSSVLPNTRIAQPKPIGVPVSASSPLSLSPSTPLPDQSIRSGHPIGNIARLEATAERLSTGTSSIGDAIRELHGELKRSDSRRSSTRAASIRNSTDDYSASVPPVPPVHRHLTSVSSILSTNTAARQGGYSPAGFVMSPSHSLTGRLRSGSKNSAGRPEIDVEPVLLSRHGPGKASVRSVRSAKMSLAEISESEPISLTKDALDAADAAPPIESDTIDEAKPPAYGEYSDIDDHGPGRIHDSAHKAEANENNLGLGVTQPDSQSHQPAAEQPERPSSAQSYSTFHQMGDAFADFDGVHCEEDGTFGEFHLQLDEQNFMGNMPPREEDVSEAVPRPRRLDRVRPQSYIDPSSGQQMLFYPARVPAMLNLPPKLSNKPKAADRNNRRSQVLSAMLDPQFNYEEQEAEKQAEASAARDSWLPDPLAGNRQSFIALSNSAGLIDAKDMEGMEEPANPEADSAHLRRPQKIGRNRAENRKSRLDKLPPQLRASAFFDLPSTSPNIETKDGSAMATLDSMLDASMTAPVNAFTNHAYGGHLGTEVYGKEKKAKPKAASSLAPPSPPKEAKKRASFLWFKRSQSESKIDSQSAMGEVHSEIDAAETTGLASSHGGDEHNEDVEGQNMDEESEDGQPAGPPTTLLAELQMRKQQQKQRTQPISQKFQDGMHATLLEMDAVAEIERKHRQTKRVNLAWEDPGANPNKDGSDDEDVPLAIIAAKNQGAKNMADLERPLGLLERRDIEDNEPLSRRRARLQGNEPLPLRLPKRQSVATLTAHLTSPYMRMQPQTPNSATEQEPTEEEIEGETLGERKRRLEAKELPKARPVSSAFSAELLSQFGDLDEATKTETSTAEGKAKGDDAPPSNPEEETLGERRRRLQAERRAREIEMSHNALIGPSSPAVSRRLSMADMLAAHPKKEENPARLERQKMEQEAIIAREREAKLVAMRRQMPTSMGQPNAGGYRGGVYNDGLAGASHAGLGLQGAVSSPALLGAQQAGNPRHRSAVGLSSYGMPGQQQPVYAASNNHYGGGINSMGNVSRMTMNPYAQHSMHQLPVQSQLPMPGPSMNRVEQWRHGVVP